MKLKNIKSARNKTSQLGFTLIELMISLALGAIVISGLISVYVATVVSSYDTIAMSKLSQQTTALVNIMTSDIRRAGYWGNASIDIDRSPAVNPFSTSGVTALGLLDSIAGNTVIAGNSATTGTCIAYTYDVDEDGVLDNEDIVGFRLNGTVAQMRRLGNNANSTQISCTNGTWEDLTDSDIISVDTLTFSLVNSMCINNREPDEVDNDGDGTIDDADEMDCYTDTPGTGDITTEVLQITINISASLVNDSDVKMNMSQVVRVRNDRVREW
jgi:type IV pilus assembly protein PilW